MRLPGRGARLAPDDRLARPEVGEEYIDGRRIEVMGAEAAHADPQCSLATIVRMCLASDYIASTELLTRTDLGSDFASDVCVRREGTDPETGGRYVEEIAFEIANTQTRRNLERVKMPKLAAAGVRRSFAVLAREGKVLEWLGPGGKGSAAEWREWAPEQEIEDDVFLQPLSVRAILDAAEVEPLVAKALLAKREPYLMGALEKERSRGEARGEAKGLAEAILRVFDSHGIRLDSENQQAVLACRDTALLRRWLSKALAAESASELLAELEAG